MNERQRPSPTDYYRETLLAAKRHFRPRTLEQLRLELCNPDPCEVQDPESEGDEEATS